MFITHTVTGTTDPMLSDERTGFIEDTRYACNRTYTNTIRGRDIRIRDSYNILHVIKPYLDFNKFRSVNYRGAGLYIVDDFRIHSSHVSDILSGLMLRDTTNKSNTIVNLRELANIIENVKPNADEYIKVAVIMFISETRLDETLTGDDLFLHPTNIIASMKTDETKIAIHSMTTEAMLIDKLNAMTKSNMHSFSFQSISDPGVKKEYYVKTSGTVIRVKSEEGDVGSSGVYIHHTDSSGNIVSTKYSTHDDAAKLGFHVTKELAEHHGDIDAKNSEDERKRDLKNKEIEFERKKLSHEQAIKERNELHKLTMEEKEKQYNADRELREHKIKEMEMKIVAQERANVANIVKTALVTAGSIATVAGAIYKLYTVFNDEEAG